MAAPPVGRALCIGVDADADARMFAALAIERGFLAPALLLGDAATRVSVRAKIAEIAAVSAPGDLFLLTFCGHGGRTRIRVNGEIRDAGTWQLYDGTLNDEQLKTDLLNFRRGVRVLVVSDNCGGGMPAPRPNDLKASVLVFAACEEGRYADGAGRPGHFSEALRSALSGDPLNYRSLHESLYDRMPPYQKPDVYRLGTPDAAFEAQQPFTIWPGDYLMSLRVSSDQNTAST